MQSSHADGGFQPLRDAATVVLLRGQPGMARRPQVLLLRRRSGRGFAAGAWVFPGGTVDPADCQLPHARWRGLDLDDAAARLGTSAPGALGFHVAAVRETLEESGILLACQGSGRPLEPGDSRREVLRAALADHAAARPLAELVAELGLVLDLGALVAFSRWMTPRVEPTRFDTVFFCAAAPEEQVASVDGHEVVDQCWIDPATALAAHRAGELAMIVPTIKTLEWLARFDRVEEILAAAASRAIEPVLPHIEHVGDEVRVLLPTDEGYPDDLRAEMEART